MRPRQENNDHMNGGDPDTGQETTDAGAGCLTNPAVARRWLPTELKRARQTATLKQNDVAKAMDWSITKMSRIENGLVSISRNDLRVLVAYYQITDQRYVDALLQAAKAASGSSPWADYQDICSSAWLEYIGLEQGASDIHIYEHLCIPDLLQTKDYALALQTSVYGHDVPTAQRLAALQEQRQQHLRQRPTPPKMSFVLTTEAVQRATHLSGAELQAEQQLVQLKQHSAAPHISIQIIPIGAGLRPGMMSPLRLLHFQDHHIDDITYPDHSGPDTLGLDNPEHASHHFTTMHEVAMSPGNRNALLDRLITDLRLRLAGATTTGSRIKALRSRKKMSATQLAHHIDVGPPVMSRIENGQRALRTHELVAIAAALRVSPLTILGEPG